MATKGTRVGAARSSQAVAGFYCAHHPWLDGHRGRGGLHKVGFTSNLGARLRDDAYITAFSEGWSFAFTVECASAEEAHLLETAVLHCLQARRLDGRELVEAHRAEIEAIATGAAKALGLRGTVRDRPDYPRPAARRGASAKKSGTPCESSKFGAAERAAVAHLALGVAGEAPVTHLMANAADADVDDYLGELFGGADDVAVAEAVAVVAEVATGLAALKIGDTSGVAPDVASGWLDQMEARSRVAASLPDQDEDAAADLMDFVDLGGVNTYADALPLEERAYQVEARAACLAELAATRGLPGHPHRGGRAILQMACRCGKTLVAYGVAAEYLWPTVAAGATPPRVLILVPGLPLLRQTVQKLAHYGAFAECLPLLVGSDSRPIDFPGARAAGAGQGPAMTTDPTAIAAALATPKPLLVISTYQSSDLLPDVFDLTIFDEAHRVCGPEGPRPFTQVLFNHHRGDRLYMTATPRYDAPVSMKNRELFGGVAYRYHMRDGIDAGYVNDFSLELLGAPAPEAVAAGAAAAGGGGVLGAIGAAFGWALRGSEPPPYTAMTALAAQVLEAASDPETGKLLVFCRSIRHAAELQQAVEALAVYWRASAAPGSARLPEFVTLAAHSRMPAVEVARSLWRFAAPGERAILFNCRLLQEGVEIPLLNGVLFAAPRHSPRDIIQSLCRPLNAFPGKPPSKIYIPLTYDPGLDPADPANLERFSSIVPFMDALMAEDPLLYEHLLNPAETPYPIRWVESRAAAAGRVKLARYNPDRLLAAARLRVRGGGRAGGLERLLRAARIPWRIGFAELERIVRECGRYVKTTDKFVYGKGADAAGVNFHGFYEYCRESYKKWKAGQVQPLEPHQLNDLRSLPEWETRGLEGPYPWAECLEVLEAWLRDHGGVPPMLEINTGGYVGLDASPYERLSGALTCINQGDGKDRKNSTRPGSGFTVDAAKQRDLDALCARWGLRWRKERGPPPPGAAPGAVGPLVCDEKGKYAGPPSFIQEAHARFKEEWKVHKHDSEYISTYFSDYPNKHRRQERLDVLEAKSAPPRWRKKTKRIAGKGPGGPGAGGPGAGSPGVGSPGGESSRGGAGDFFRRLIGRKGV